tara:strand:+ start:4431 stop:5798 length:1368 start_codon:yes stop_codon:yes gene_type:complete
MLNLDADKFSNIFFKIILTIVSLILVVNIFGYFHELGYDGEHHKWYIEVLPFDLPKDTDTKEFFSPPLPYFLPSIIDSVCDKTNELEITDLNCTFIYGKITQAIQGIIFILIFFILRNIAELIHPNNKEYFIALILLFAMIPLSYKSFAMIRGEPYISFFMFLSINLIMSICYKTKKINAKNILLTGFFLGLMGLSRQWGLLFFPSLVVLLFFVLKDNEKKFNISFFRYSIFSFIVSLGVFGWFYALLFIEYGSITAFNREPSTFSFQNQTLSFYFGLGLEDIFSKPIRGFSMTNMVLPVLYADTWGDYWGYFTVTMGRGGLNTNYEIVPYLGRVNLFSLIPTVCFIAGIFLFIKNQKFMKRERLFYILIFSAINFIWFGYLWFLIKYPIPQKGDTIKGTYILNLIHLLPFFGAYFLDRIKEFSKKFFNFLFALLLIIFIHNIPAMITRFFGGYI